ncbi:DUF4255 domain-containing protein [Methylococcaceae bacterium WWC4]|nr:DUF4255 domain-containing protein [Methylococcaceae bacterium WWC4]
MSNSLAVATVTAALATLIQNAAQQAVSGAEVVLGRPQTAPPANALRWVQLCLYQVTPNPALRNADLPTRDPSGRISQRPQIALDLHYLLAFYGDETAFEAQRMLGAVARDLHAHPVLTRQAVHNAALSHAPLNDSNLDQAPELVRLTPLPLNLDELSKLWSVFFQTPYALSIAYRASVVLIESDDAVNPAPPVLQRGRDDRGVETLLGLFPRLETIRIGFADNRDVPLPSLPNAWPGLVLTFGGQDLQGDSVTLRFQHPRLGSRDVAIPEADRDATSLRFTLPDDAAAQTDWAAGLYEVAAIVSRDGTERTTNRLSLPLAIRVDSILPANPVARAAGDATLTMAATPQVLTEQAPLLLLGDREVAAQARINPSDPLVFVIENAAPVSLQPVYIRVDGVDSLPFAFLDHPPRYAFADSQRVTIV